MNKISTEDIQNYLIQHYHDKVNEYGLQSIIGCFIVGKANYNFAENVGDISIITIYMPSFDELCVGISKANKNERVFDIRNLYNAARDEGIIALELLYTNYYYINPKFKQCYEDMLKDRELIAHVNERARLSRALTRMKTAFAEKNYFEVIRLYSAADLYYKGFSCEECFHIKDLAINSILQTAEENDFCVTYYNDMITRLEHIIGTLPAQPNIEAEEIYKQHIVNFVTIGLKENISLEAFINNLTETEKEAFSVIKSKVDMNGEGNISISKMIEETKISRPVFNNLFIKIRNNDIAEIVNQGVKGTYIKFKTFI